MRGTLKKTIGLAAAAAALAVSARTACADAAQGAARSAQRPLRAFAYVGLLYQVNALHFDETEQLPTFLEAGARQTAYSVGTGPVVDLGLGRSIRGPLGVAVAISWRDRSADAAFVERVPHPFFFNQPRMLSGDAGLEGREAAIHAQLTWMRPLTARVQLVLAGGPSFFHVTQGTVSDVAYSESYPYEAVTYEGAVLGSQSRNAVGFNAEAGAILPLSRRAGVQAAVRYSHASVTFTSRSGTFGVPAGGTQAGVGLRVRF